jgi:hypothetical protein
MPRRNSKLTGVLLVVGIAYVAGTPAAFGDLPPAAYQKMQDNAPEHLQIKVLSVKTTEEQDGLQVFAEAKVTVVKRSGSGVKVGDVIGIEYFHDTRRVPGPSPVPTLVQDQSYEAFLRLYSARQKIWSYSPAAGGASFPPAH